MRNAYLRVYVIESHPLLRVGLTATLEQIPRVQLLGEAASEGDALGAIDNAEVDLVLVDGALGAPNEWRLVRELSLLCRTVVVLSNDPDADLVGAQQAGAHFCVGKTLDRNALEELLQNAAQARSSDSNEPSGGRSHPADLIEDGIDPRAVLSPRELQILRLTAEGKEAKEIAAELDLSPRTVDVHRNNIRNKLGIRGAHDLLRLGMQWLAREKALAGIQRFRDEPRPLLLIEDDAVDILSVRRAMRDLRPDAPLVVKRDGEEALEYLRDLSNPLPFLILLDIKMPKMAGHEFLAEIRGDPRLDSLPVVALTASKEDPDVRRMHAFHLVGYLVKPSSSREFQEMFAALARFWSLGVPVPTPPPKAPPRAS